MRHSLGASDMVRWQGRRIGGEARARSRMARLALLFAALSVASLVIGFYSGLPVPLDLLQTLTLLLVVGAAVFAVRLGFDRLANRGERGIHRRR